MKKSEQGTGLPAINKSMTLAQKAVERLNVAATKAEQETTKAPARIFRAVSSKEGDFAFIKIGGLAAQYENGQLAVDIASEGEQ